MLDIDWLTPFNKSEEIEHPVLALIEKFKLFPAVTFVTPKGDLI